MKMIRYPIIFILSFFAFLSISLFVGFLLFKFIVLFFDDTDNKDWRKVAKEVRDIAKKNKL